MSITTAQRAHMEYLSAPASSAAPRCGAEGWWARDIDPALFEPVNTGGMSSDHPDAQAALRICRTCPVRPQCLVEAIATGELHMIRGGITPAELRLLAADVDTAAGVS